MSQETQQSSTAVKSSLEASRAKTGGAAKLDLGGNSIELPIIIGTEDEKAIDISDLRAKTSFITFDPGFVNTGSCISDICFIDGEKGILRYRGFPIEQLAEKSTFVETCYLLIFGKLPTQKELDHVKDVVTNEAAIPDGVQQFFHGFPRDTHPMAILASIVAALSGGPAFLTSAKDDEVNINQMALRLISQIRTIAACTYKKSIGESFVKPQPHLSYCENFLHMMFAPPGHDYQLDKEAVEALNLLLILHADHEQNCSASTARLVGSSRSNLGASVAAAICALWGPLHGGANEEVVEMLDEIVRGGADVALYVKMAKDPKTPKRLSGFGHRVYKTFDPRARVIKQACHRLLKKLNVSDPLFDVALKLEETALKDDFFISRKLYPNVDFYSGLIYRALGIPTNMFTVMFAVGRLPGWIAHWKEMREFKPPRIGRPRQVYTGETLRDYVPMSERK